MSTTEELEVPTKVVYGLITAEGTAMGETAVCSEHIEAMREETEAFRQNSTEMGDVQDLVDVSPNEAMFCQFCGLNGYGETSYDEDDE